MIKTYRFYRNGNISIEVKLLKPSKEVNIVILNNIIYLAKKSDHYISCNECECKCQLIIEYHCFSICCDTKLKTDIGIEEGQIEFTRMTKLGDRISLFITRYIVYGNR